MTTPTHHAEDIPHTGSEPDAPTHAPRSAFARVPSAVRLQFSPAVTLIGVPLLVFFGAWLIAIGIGVWIHSTAGPGAQAEAEAPAFTGASQAPLWALVFVAAYSASHTFPFSMALSYSRRTFMLGVIIAFGIVSACFGAAFVVAALVERVTEGFGIGIYTFDIPYLTQGDGGAGGCWGVGLRGLSLLHVDRLLLGHSVSKSRAGHVVGHPPLHRGGGDRGSHGDLSE